MKKPTTHCEVTHFQVKKKRFVIREIAIKDNEEENDILKEISIDLKMDIHKHDRCMLMISTCLREWISFGGGLVTEIKEWFMIKYFSIHVLNGGHAKL